MTKSMTTAKRLCEYVKEVESETDKTVKSARVEGRAIVLEFDTGRTAGSTNPADLVDP